jgi:hypothetical protein
MSFPKLICFSVIVPLSVFAAQEAPQQTIESLKTRKATPGIAAAQTWQLTQNEDIGQIELVRRETPPPTLTLATAQSFFYTDNVSLTERGRIESIGWDGWFGAVLVPWSTARWRPSISGEQHLFRYKNASQSDFDAQILTLASALSLNDERTWSWNFSYSLWRLYSGHADHHEFYKQGELVNSIGWYRPLSADPNLGLRLSTTLAWRHVTPSIYDRLSAESQAGLEYYPIPSLQIFPFVNVAGRYYPTDTSTIRNRRDFNLQSGLSITWRPHKNIGISGAVSWVGNYSSSNTLDYDVLLPILGVGASVSF